MDLHHVCRKRDHCIWFAHLPPHLARQFEALAPDSPLPLLINGCPTVWKRMKPGGGRAVRGIRIESGKDIWKTIDLGSEFTLEAVPPSTQAGPHQPSPADPRYVGDTQNVPISTSVGPTLFGAYLFADYSGAERPEQQRRAIRVAYGEGSEPVGLVQEQLDRAALVDFIVRRLRSASERGVRVCLGQDHAFGLPLGFARDLGISQLQWRTAIGTFLDAKYCPSAPAFRDLKQFACEMNRWLTEHHRNAYFWSATKAKDYNLPDRDPRKDEADGSSYRLTDRCRAQSGRGNPKPFNRLGDPGTVGGQSLLGMVRIRALINRCHEERIKLRFWPFDGLDISDPEYEGAHVAVEIFPTALRPEAVEQTDANDALYTAAVIREADLSGQAGKLFDLNGLPPCDASRVRFEGWIVGQIPGTHR
jgi:hypothetical protein